MVNLIDRDALVAELWRRRWAARAAGRYDAMDAFGEAISAVLDAKGDEMSVERAYAYLLARLRLLQAGGSRPVSGAEVIDVGIYEVPAQDMPHEQGGVFATLAVFGACDAAAARRAAQKAVVGGDDVRLAWVQPLLRQRDQLTGLEGVTVDELVMRLARQKVEHLSLQSTHSGRTWEINCKRHMELANIQASGLTLLGALADLLRWLESMLPPREGE